MELIIPPKEKIESTNSDCCPFQYFSNVPFIKYVYLSRLDMAIEMLENKRFDRILDLGCGSGILIPTLRKYSREVFGVDIHEKLPVLLKNKLGYKFTRASIDTLPFQGQSFDRIFCMSVLEHLNNLEEALKEIKRCLSKDGKVIFGIPSDNFLIKIWFKIINFNASEHINDKMEILKAIKNKFEIEKKKKILNNFFDIYTTVKCSKYE